MRLFLEQTPRSKIASFLQFWFKQHLSRRREIVTTHLLFSFEHLFMISRFDRIKLVHLPLQLRQRLSEGLQICNLVST